MDKRKRKQIHLYQSVSSSLLKKRKKGIGITDDTPPHPRQQVNCPPPMVAVPETNPHCAWG